MKFYWQQSRSEALYVEETNKQVYGKISWEDVNRLCIEAQYCGPSKDGKKAHIEIPLGIWCGEAPAKQAVEQQVSEFFPPEVEG